MRKQDRVSSSSLALTCSPSHRPFSPCFPSLTPSVDFVAPPVCKALAVLFDAVPPMPGPAVRAVIEAELGGTVESFFEGLDLDKPIGSASLALLRGGGVGTVCGERGAVGGVDKGGAPPSTFLPSSSTPRPLSFLPLSLSPL